MNSWRPSSFGFRLAPRVAAAAVFAPAAFLPLLGPAAVSQAVAPAYRTGNPPILHSATIDAQRRLVVVFSAPDGMTYGGTVYLDNDPRDADPPATPDPKYRNPMHCNNKGTCLARWNLPDRPGPSLEKEPTFISEPLDLAKFPPGQYWVQVETYDEDPFPSTRYWENSLVKPVPLPNFAPGTGGDDSTDSDEVRLESVQIRVLARSIDARIVCKGGKHFRASVELATLKGSGFFSGLLIGTVEKNGVGLKRISWDGAYPNDPSKPPTGFVVSGSKVVCWKDSKANGASHRPPFTAQCPKPSAQCVAVFRSDRWRQEHSSLLATSVS